MKVWIVTEFANCDVVNIASSCEVFSKRKTAYDFANRDSKAFRTVTEKIVDKYIPMEVSNG